ncbi:MAG: type VII secretion protein EccE [Micromonosporaceae bacterium]
MTRTTTLALPANETADAEVVGAVEQSAEPTRPRPRPPAYRPRGVASRHVAAVSVGLVVWWQLVALVVVMSGGWSNGVRLAVTIGCGLALVLSMARWRRRWLPGWLITYLRYRGRVRRAEANPAPPLAAVTADLETVLYTDRTGNIVGLARDGECWTSLVRVGLPLTTDAEQTRGHLADMLDVLAASLDEGEPRVAAVQLVSWAAAQPAQQASPPDDQEAADPGPATPDPSTAQRTSDPSTVQRQYWVALRLVPHRARQDVEARGGGETGEPRTIAAATLRLAGQLITAGYPVEVCDDADLTAQLATALGIPATPSGADAGQPVESWRAWSVGALHQACYALRHHPDTTEAMAEAAGRLAAVPALFTCVSTLLERNPTGEVVSQTLVRLGVAAGPTETEKSEALQRAAVGLGPDTARLDGAHAVVVPATLPLARRAEIGG